MTLTSGPAPATLPGTRPATDAGPATDTVPARDDAGGDGASPAGRRAALTVAMLGFAVVTLDAQITNVALPVIHQHLGGGLAGLQWVVTGYTLMFSTLLLFGGTIADRIGSRSAYRNGMLLFVAASMACGLAPTLPALIVARLVQGVGAALVTPTALSLIREAYDDATERARAIAYWGVGGSIAAAAGPILGGLLTQLDWRLIFFINLPVGVIALLVLREVVPSPRRATPIDRIGQPLAVLTLAALTYAFIEGGSRGFGDPLIIAAFVVAVAAFITFLASQARGAHPMVPLRLFRSRPVATSLSIAFISMAAFYGVVFLQSLYFQQERGYSPLASGLLFLPMTGLVAIASAVWARIGHRFTRRSAIIAGQLGMIAGLIALALTPATAPVWTVALLMILVGVGGAVTVPPIAALILDTVPAQLAGTASGVLNTARQMGGSLGVAVFGAVVNAVGGFATGLRFDYTVTAAALALTVVVTALTARGGNQQA